ncbi:MAG TPA: hypothetical protein VGS27_33320 [Candidatus Sulfotelmatobacter sp.]|nr:hypothetical protein [Candidatus Sulfotelmatobacter sp.]
MRTWTIACAVFIVLLLIPAAIEYRISHPTVPPGVQRSECLTPPPDAESSYDWLIRLGGRVSRDPNSQWQENGFTSPEIAQGRNLGRYEKLALKDPEPHHFSEMTGNPTMAQARSFLWDHWRKHKRAYLILTLTGIDNTGTSHIFVEPDDTGRWRIYRRHLDSRVLVDEPTAYSVAWVAPSEADKPAELLATGAIPDPKSDELEFHDVCGERTGEF